MEWRTYSAYRSWMERWLPHILYGADGARAEADQRARMTSNVADLPGGSIVKAGC